MLSSMLKTVPSSSHEPLLTQAEILERIFGSRLNSKKFDRMRRAGLFPTYKLGHRTLLYSEAEVRSALRRLRVNSVQS
jgi:hypothetical protein